MQPELALPPPPPPHPPQCRGCSQQRPAVGRLTVQPRLVSGCAARGVHARHDAVRGVLRTGRGAWRHVVCLCRRRVCCHRVLPPGWRETPNRAQWEGAAEPLPQRPSLEEGEVSRHARTPVRRAAPLSWCYKRSVADGWGVLLGSFASLSVFRGRPVSSHTHLSAAAKTADGRLYLLLPRPHFVCSEVPWHGPFLRCSQVPLW